MLSYNDLTDLCEKKHLTITEVAIFSGMTLSGFRNAMRKKALVADRIEAVCNILDISPNDFFNYKAQSGDSVNGAQNKNGRTQIIYQTPPELTDTIQTLKDQLKIKDDQISKLIEKI